MGKIMLLIVENLQRNSHVSWANQHILKLCEILQLEMKTAINGFLSDQKFLINL